MCEFNYTLVKFDRSLAHFTFSYTYTHTHTHTHTHTPTRTHTHQSYLTTAVEATIGNILGPALLTEYKVSPSIANLPLRQYLRACAEDPEKMRLKKVVIDEVYLLTLPLTTRPMRAGEERGRRGGTRQVCGV